MAGMMDGMEGMVGSAWQVVSGGCVMSWCSSLRLDDDVDGDDEDRSCSNGLSMVFIALAAVDEHVNASNPARKSQPSSDSVHHVLCPILGYQQDMKHSIPDEVEVEWIKTNMARTTL